MSEFLKFTKVGNKVFNLELISSVDCSEIEKLVVRINFLSGNTETVEGLDAIDLLMLIKPSMLEGKRLKYPKHRWVVHNLIAHPLMQILCLIGFKTQGIWIHEITIPRPIGIR